MENRRYRVREKTDRAEPPQMKAYSVEIVENVETDEVTPVDDGIQRRKMINVVRILVGIAVILVCVSLLVALIGWVKQDVLTSVLFLQSGIR